MNDVRLPYRRRRRRRRRLTSVWKNEGGRS